nr:acyltransferase [uncultured Brevundimonas sp.]
MQILIYKAGVYGARLMQSFVLRFWYGLIWRFEGKILIEGVIRTMAVRGEVIMGDGVALRNVAQIDCLDGAELRIGRQTTVNRGVLIVVRQQVTIGNNVLIGEYVSIRDNDHAFADADALIQTQGFTSAPVVIGDDVWIGRSVVIGKGVTIGNGVVIGANSVVTKNVPAYAVVAGVPARVIKWRREPELIL